LSRPLDRLARTAMQLGAGDAGVVAPRSGVTEVDAIAEALEESGQRVAALVAAERQFSANASHQLRSPLTAIAISLELIADCDDPVARHEAVEALNQVAGLDERINDLLQLARTGRVAPPERTDVVALVGRHLETIGPQFEHAGRRLSFVAPEPVEAVVTPSALTQGIEILLDNALVHGEGDVEVRTAATADGAEISVTDQGHFDDLGNGVSTSATSGDAHRSHGLGLVLARNLLRPDGGRVELTSTSPTTFVVRLPAATVAANGASSADLLSHERGVRHGEQHDDAADQGGDLPPGEHETLRQ
ncbi:MAG TPA: HAMP domain-containing sensor histidine kinase, partial [Ilumatobacteraceae bacterium]